MRNGKFVCFNDVIANCTSCNTNVLVLGSVKNRITPPEVHSVPTAREL